MGTFALARLGNGISRSLILFHGKQDAIRILYQIKMPDADCMAEIKTARRVFLRYLNEIHKEV